MDKSHAQGKKSQPPKESKLKSSGKLKTLRAAAVNVNGKRNLSVDATKDTFESQTKKQKQVNTDAMVKSAPSLSKSQKRRLKRKMILQKMTVDNKAKQNVTKTDTSSDKTKTGVIQSKKKRWKKKKGKSKRSDGGDLAEVEESVPGNASKESDTEANVQTGKHESKIKFNPKSRKSPTKGKSEQGAANKVHTHAALYRNPVDVSSNWKKMLQVCWTCASNFITCTIYMAE